MQCEGNNSDEVTTHVCIRVPCETHRKRTKIADCSKWSCWDTSWYDRMMLSSKCFDDGDGTESERKRAAWTIWDSQRSWINRFLINTAPLCPLHKTSESGHGSSRQLAIAYLVVGQTVRDIRRECTMVVICHVHALDEELNLSIATVYLMVVPALATP